MGNMMARRRALIAASTPLITTDPHILTIAKKPIAGTQMKHLYVILSQPGSSINLTTYPYNIFDHSDTFDPGYYNDSGVWTTSANSGYSESYTAVDADTSYTIVGMLKPVSTYAITYAVYYYDSSKQWISREKNPLTQGTTCNWMTFTTPSNCAYVRFQFIQDGADPASYGFDKSKVVCCKTDDRVLRAYVWDDEYGDQTGVVDVVTGYFSPTVGNPRLVMLPISFNFTGDEMAFWTTPQQSSAVYFGYA